MTAPLPPRRILSVWLRRLSTDRIERRSRERPESPLVVAASIKSARRIVALNDAAARLGLRVDMALADARAMYPSLAAADAEPEADRQLLEAVADWCDRYTPLVGLDAPGGLFLDIGGCAHLFGGETALCRDMHRRLSAQGLHVGMAIAPNAGCAWAVARYGDCGIVRNDGLRNTLLPLPLAALRLSPDIVANLAASGLKYVRDIVDLPRSPLAARFGADLLRKLDRAFDREDEPIVPRLPVPSYVVERRFPEPVAREEDVLGTIAHLAEELSRAMERHGDGARRLQVALFRADGKVERIEVGTGEPLRDPQRMCRLFIDRLAVLADEYDPGFGFDVVRLCALDSARLDPMQTGLDNARDCQELEHLIDRFSARFGAQRALRLLPNDTHIPEYAVRAVAAQRVAQLSDGEAAELRKTTNVRFPKPASLSSEDSERWCDSLIPARPIRLFERPEPIEAIAEVPDGPPVRFRWRRVLHVIAHAEGPERIGRQWWSDEKEAALTRDYFRIESRDGVRAWLFREGLYGRETERPNWFLHGLFA